MSSSPDLHVQSITYSLCPLDSVTYNNPPPIDVETEYGSLRLSDNKLVCSMKTHFGELVLALLRRRHGLAIQTLQRLRQPFTREAFKHPEAPGLGHAMRGCPGGVLQKGQQGGTVQRLLTVHACGLDGPAMTNERADLVE